MDEVNNSEFLKIVVCGEGGVGKTSFLNKVINDTFDEHSQLTKGVEFHNKKVTLSLHGKDYELIFWDFGGQDRFRELLADFVDGTSCAIFIFDLTRYNTLDKLEEWLEILSEEDSHIPLVILGAKEDLIDDEKRKFFLEMLEKIVDAYKEIFGYLLISNKTGYNIQNALDLIVQRLNQ